ncbi:hypothetical protein Tco_0135888, partial [Tanacetum coccineum]
MSHLSQLAADANSIQLTNIMALLFHNDNQSLVGSNVAAESIRLLKEFQYDDLESIRGMMRCHVVVVLSFVKYEG